MLIPPETEKKLIFHTWGASNIQSIYRLLVACQVNGIRAISSHVSDVTFEIWHTGLFLGGGGGFSKRIGSGIWVSVRERTPGRTVGFGR